MIRLLLLVINLLMCFETHAFQELLFSEELIAEGDYYRALTELKKIEFRNRREKLGFETQKKILQIHIKAKDFENFDSSVEKLLQFYSKYLPNFDPQIIKAETAFLIGNETQAYNLITNTQANIEEKYYFKAFLEDPPEDLKCDTSRCEEIKKVEKKIARAKSSKSEKLALLFGLIPGMGQVYAGNVTSGVGSFALNSFFAALAVIAFNNDEPAMGIASSVVGGTFYLSSIYAGYETARRHNLSMANKAKASLYDIPIKLQLLNIVWD